MSKFNRKDFDISNLGPAELISPLQGLRHEANADFVTDEHRILFDYSLEKVKAVMESGAEPVSYTHLDVYKRQGHEQADCGA